MWKFYDFENYQLTMSVYIYIIVKKLDKEYVAEILLIIKLKNSYVFTQDSVKQPQSSFPVMPFVEYCGPMNSKMDSHM
jgi:hypothetical protein